MDHPVTAIFVWWKQVADTIVDYSLRRLLQRSIKECLLEYHMIMHFRHFSTPDSVYGNLIKTSNHVTIPSFNCIEPPHDAIKRETIIINNSFAE